MPTRSTSPLTLPIARAYGPATTATMCEHPRARSIGRRLRDHVKSTYGGRMRVVKFPRRLIRKLETPDLPLEALESHPDCEKPNGREVPARLCEFQAFVSGYNRSLGKKEDARLAPRRWASSVGSAPCGYSNRLRPTPGSSRCALGATTRSSSIVIRRADHVCSLNAGVRDSPQSTTGGLPRGRR